ncbi:hypothetical protein ACIB24_10240 [Spongisporangium articulatum]|uniref:Uncharacterized protein n=1 Tax=Spongisporangium articulatum TaxID=3362603 RepID=A0ABW8AM39_9ACTN
MTGRPTLAIGLVRIHPNMLPMARSALSVAMGGFAAQRGMALEAVVGVGGSPLQDELAVRALLDRLQERQVGAVVLADDVPASVLVLLRALPVRIVQVPSSGLTRRD